MNVFDEEWVLGSSILALAWVIPACSPPQPEEKFVFETDDRRDFYAGNVLERQAAQAVALRVHRQELQPDSQTGKFLFHGAAPMKMRDWCEDEPFSHQWTPDANGTCTGFKVGENLLLTSNHCIKKKPGEFCRLHSFVFGFGLNDVHDRPDLGIPKENVYDCEKVVASGKKGFDWLLVELQPREPRTTAASSWLKLAESKLEDIGLGADPSAKLTMIGHPSALPLKITRNGNVLSKDVDESNLCTDLDAWSGNSGSPVFRAEALARERFEIEGIAIKANADKFKVSPPAECGVIKRKGGEKSPSWMYPPDEPRVVGGAVEPAGWRDEQSNETKLDRGTSAAGARARGARGAEHG